MKRDFKILFIAMVLVIACMFVSCKDSGNANTDDTPEPDAKVTATPLPTPLPTQTPLPTLAPLSEPEAQKIPEGKMIYYEDFDSYANTASNDATFEALRKNGVWKIDDKENVFYPESISYSDKNTSQYTIEDGKLVVRNYKDANGNDISGKDSYIIIEDENYLWEVYKDKYTIQYDVTYGESGNAKRYLSLMWNYWGQCYNSFHFRVCGYANYQIHYNREGLDGWFDIDSTSAEYCAKAQDDAGIPSIAMRLLGENINGRQDTVFKGIPVTIRIQVDPEKGATIWMRTDCEGAVTNDWVKITEAVAGTVGERHWNDYFKYCHGGSLCLKTGTTMNGSIDNIMVWTGFGEVPSDHTVNFTPTSLK